MEPFYEKGKKYNFRVNGVPYFRATVTINGKRHQVYGDGEKDAKKKIEELKKLAATGVNLDYQKANTGEVFKHWFYDIKRSDKKLKASSMARYDGAYKKHIAPYPIMNEKLSRLNSAKFQSYLTALHEEHGVSGSTAELVCLLWKMFCSWCLDEGYINKDPCRKAVLPGKYDKGKKEIEVFTEAERAAILTYMEKTKYQYDTVIKLAFSTGMRMGELFALRWEDITSDGVIHVKHSTNRVTHIDKDGNKERYRELWETKSKNSVRNIPMTAATHEMLKKHHAQQKLFFVAHGLGTPEYVFTTETGEIISHSNFRKSYQRMLQRAGVPYRKFHAIRHTFATEAIRRGVDVKDLQLILGHSDVQTTYIYVQSDDESRKDAIEKIGAIV